MDPTTAAPHVRTRAEGDFTVVAICGALDIANTYALREWLLDVMHRNGSRLVLDLSGVSFCDARGLAAMVATRRRADLLGGTLRLAGPRPQLLELLRLTGLHRHLATYPTTAAACTSPVATRPNPGRALRSSVGAGDGAGADGLRRSRQPRTPSTWPVPRRPQPHRSWRPLDTAGSTRR